MQRNGKIRMLNNPQQVETGWLMRPRLVNRFLKNGQWLRGVVTAPSGYGKTVLLAQIAAEYPHVIWLPLTRFEHEASGLLKVLIEEMAFYCSSLNYSLLASSLTQAKPVQEIIVQLADQYRGAAGEGLLLIIDNFNRIDDIDVIQTLVQLMLYLPGIRILIASQNCLPQGLNLGVEENNLVELTADDLKFTMEETLQLFAGLPCPDKFDRVAQFQYHFGGFVAALRLQAALGERGGDQNAISQKVVYNFSALAARILKRYPKEWQRFLIETAVLIEVSPDFCDLLLERNDSAQILKVLSTEALTLCPTSSKRTTYRHYEIFRRFLENQLTEERRRELQIKLGRLYYEKAEIAQAVECFLAAGDWESAVEVIVAVACPLKSEALITSKSISRISRWLEAVPGERKLQDLRLGVLYAEVKFYNGALAESDKWINRVIEQLILRDELSGLNRALALKSRIMFARGDLGELSSVFELISKSSPEPGNEEFTKGQAVTIFFAMGRLDLAIQLFERQLVDAKLQKRRYAIENLNRALCALYYLAGDYQKALELVQAVQAWNGKDLSQGAFLCLPSLYRKWGELDRATIIAEQNVALYQKLEEPNRLAWSYFELGAIYVDRGALQKAETYFRMVIELAHDQDGQAVIQALAQIHLGLCFTLQGQLGDAQKLMMMALRKFGGNIGYLQALGRVYSGPILIQCGRYTEALHMLQNSLEFLEQFNAKFLLCLCLGLLAGVYGQQRDGQTAAHKCSARCLELAAQNNFIQMFLTLTPYLKTVLRMSLEYSWEIGFVTKILTGLGESAYPIFMEFTVHPDSAVRLRVVKLLSQMAGCKGATVIAVFGNDINPEIRALARATLSSKTERIVESWNEKGLLRICSLGAFGVYVTGPESKATVNWPTKKARDLLAYLAHQDKPVARERLLEDLWPEMGEKKITPLFHTTVYQVRQVLQRIMPNQEWIVYQNGEYHLAAGCFSIDRVNFKKMIDEFPAELQSDQIYKIEEAVRLWRGEYLEDLDYPWLVPEREYLKRLYIDLRSRLAHYYMNAQEYTYAIRNLNYLLQQNPLSEEWLTELMTAYAMTADRLAIKRLYEVYKQTLQDELGLTPSRELRNIYYKLCSEQKQVVN